MFYFDWTYLLIIPGLLLGMWAQHKVNSAYQQYPGWRPAWAALPARWWLTFCAATETMG